ncbi:hypothetical protein [Diplocloster modestus]|uniref:Uncharacterized protein n=1 Tax=Diplocloster modestus TaxID=2850322 RepID=A0ABS6KC13_9FIRM|nr:hypothetical protein [Diplocloster modestus]MBU9728059.1 hypothetical protein [Diplocloster modestus]
MNVNKRVTVQELAETLRNIAYSDNQKHNLCWSLSVIHPKTNDGDVGYSGGVFHNHHFKGHKDSNFSFSYSESRGIYQFHLWREHDEVRLDCVGKDGKISLEHLVKIAIDEYGIEELYSN